MGSRKVLFALGLAGLIALVSGLRSSVAQEEPPYAENEAPVYLVICFQDGFVLTPPGKATETIVVNIGSLVGGDVIGDTRFIVNSALTGITLPDGRHDPTFEDVANNAATVFGSFFTADEQGFHTAVPEPGSVAVEIQEAVFTASNSVASFRACASVFADAPPANPGAPVAGDIPPSGSMATAAGSLGSTFTATVMPG